MAVSKQFTITIGFNKEQYKKLLEIAIEKQCDTIYELVKKDVIKFYDLAENKTSFGIKKTLNQQLKELTE